MKGCEWYKHKFSVYMTSNESTGGCERCKKPSSTYYNIKNRRLCPDCYHWEEEHNKKLVVRIKKWFDHLFFRLLLKP